VTIIPVLVIEVFGRPFSTSSFGGSLFSRGVPGEDEIEVVSWLSEVCSL